MSRVGTQLRDLGANVVPARTHHDGQTLDAGVGDARQHMREHGAAGDLVQDFRKVGFHARALAGGEDDRKGCSIGRFGCRHRCTMGF